MTKTQLVKKWGKVGGRVVFDATDEFTKDLDSYLEESRLAENLVIASEHTEGSSANGAVAEAHIKCALKNLGNIADRKAERWSIVGALFGLGSGSATKLCEIHEVDPFEIIGNDKCEECELIKD